MPYIHIATNVPVSTAGGETIRREMGRAITALPGKSEQWLMVRLEDDARLWMAGSDAPAAMVQVGVYGGADAEACDSLTGRITDVLEAVLAVDPARIYVQYAQTEYWGWNSRNF